MAYDETLAARVREALGRQRGMSEKKMFGGVAFLLNGNMCCGILGSELMLRLGEAQAQQALAQPQVRVFDMTGRPMKGWVVVGTPAIADDAALARWVGAGVAFAKSLPAK